MSAYSTPRDMPSVALATPRDVRRLSSRSRLSLVGTPRRASALLDPGSNRRISAIEPASLRRISLHDSGLNRRISLHDSGLNRRTSTYDSGPTRRTSIHDSGLNRRTSLHEPTSTRKSFRLSLDPRLSLLDRTPDVAPRIPGPGGLSEPARILDYRLGNVHTPSTNIPKRRRSGSGLPPPRRHHPNPPAPQPHPLTTSQTPLHPAAHTSPAPHDTRPLRDKTYQLLISQEILDFLAANRFELETGHVIGPKNLARPTQKDFVLMYRFLYHRIDPTYAFAHAVDVDVLATLRLLQYPYLDTLNRSQISAVGGHHWPSFLGVLYYLVKLNLHLAMADAHCADLFAFEDPLDATVTNYYEAAYTAYLAGADDFSHETSLMELEFARFFEQTAADIVSLDSAISHSSRALADLQRQLADLEDARKMLAALLQDVETLGLYVHHVQERQPRWQLALDKLAADTDSARRELALVQELIAQLDRDIAARGTSFEEIDRILARHHDTDRRTHDLQRAITATADAVASHHQRALDLIAPLDQLAADYTARMQALAVLHSRHLPADVAATAPVQLAVAPHLLDTFHARLVSAADMTVPPLAQAEAGLKALHASLHAHRLDIVETSRALQDQVDAAHEAVRGVQEQVDVAAARLGALVSTREEAEDQIQRTNAAYKAEIEKRQREVRTANTLENEAYVELELEYQSSRAAHYDRAAAIARDRARWLGHAQEVAEFVVGLKMRYQSTLNGTIDVVTHEFDAVMLFNRDHGL